MTEVVMAKLMSTSLENPMKHRFQEYAAEIDQVNDKRERLVKASRDITIHSKKAIFQLHRVTNVNKANILKQAERAISNVRQTIVKRIVPELTKDDYMRFNRAYSPGMQEYIEARTFLSYCQCDSHIVTLDEINEEIHEDFDISQSEASTDVDQQQFNFNLVDIYDYILGVADLSGELMRRAITTKSQSDAVTIFHRLQEIEHGFGSLVFAKVHMTKDLKFKIQVLKQSVEKVQKTCFNRIVQMAELVDGEHAADVAVETPDERQRKKHKSLEDVSPSS